MDDRDVLKVVYLQSLRGRAATLKQLSDVLGEDGSSALLERLLKEGMVEATGSRISLTAKGRRRLRVVLIGGAFEILHPGHVHTIREARSLGDVLVAVVATDSSVVKNKGREPVTDEDSRVDLVSSLKHVDLAMLGNKGSIYDILEKVRPDVVALGYDQYHDAGEIVREGRRRGLNLEVKRLSSLRPDIKTTKILAEFR